MRNYEIEIRDHNIGNTFIVGHFDKFATKYSSNINQQVIAKINVELKVNIISLLPVETV